MNHSRWVLSVVFNVPPVEKAEPEDAPELEYEKEIVEHEDAEPVGEIGGVEYEAHQFGGEDEDLATASEGTAWERGPTAYASLPSPGRQ